jgi:uncharacterized protein YlxW (UPF0749 family)
MIGCCEIALLLGVSNVISLAIFAGYTVKLRERQFILERKNGAEQKALNELKSEVKALKEKNA